MDNQRSQRSSNLFDCVFDVLTIYSLGESCMFMCERYQYYYGLIYEMLPICCFIYQTWILTLPLFVTC